MAESFAPTHAVPAAGLSAWAAPDPAQPTVATLDAGLEVRLLEQREDGWAHVLCSNGWSAWVDGRLLAELSTPGPPPGSGSAPPAGPPPGPPPPPVLEKARSPRGWSRRRILVLGAAALVLVAVAAGIGLALSGGGGSGSGRISAGSGTSQTTPVEPPLTLPQAIGDFTLQPGGSTTPSTGVGGSYVHGTYDRASPRASSLFTAARAIGPPPGSPVQSGDAALRTRTTADLVQKEVSAVKGTLFAPGVSPVPLTSGATQYTCLSGPSSPTAQGQAVPPGTACVWSAGFTVYSLTVIPGPSPQEVAALAAQAQAATGS